MVNGESASYNSGMENPGSPMISCDPAALSEAIKYYSDLDRATKQFSAFRWPDGSFCPYFFWGRSMFAKLASF